MVKILKSLHLDRLINSILYFPYPSWVGRCSMSTVIYMDGRDLERGCEAFMKFRLTYEGPLLSSKRDDPNRHIAHKHRLRQCFHGQLKELWRTNRFLSGHTMDQGSQPLLPPAAYPILQAHNGSRPMAEVLGDVYGHHGFRYTPLIWKEAYLACSLRILCLRRDGDEAVASARDIDNRVKTVIDALTPVQLKQGAPQDEAGNTLLPGPDEDPLYVLLDDDRQVTHLEVETDTALAPDPQNPGSMDFVRLIITVETRVTQATTFNISYA
jgi:hypothetical protein